MNTAKQRETFISYSRTDKEFALEFAREMKSAGYLVWLDQLDIPTGARWDDEVEKALRKCEIFLIILTPASVSSDNVKDEIGYAIDHGKRILPVLLEKCDVPLRLRRFQYVDFTKLEFNKGISRAKELLQILLDEQPAPEATTDPRIEPQKAIQKEAMSARPLPSKIRSAQRQRLALGAGVLAIAACFAVLGALFFLRDRLSSQISRLGLATGVPAQTESEAFKIDLGQYAVGDIAANLGTDLLVCERDGRKCLTGYNYGGKLDITDLNLSSSFDLEFEVDWNDADGTVLLQSGAGDEIMIRFDDANIAFGNTEKYYGSTGWKGNASINKCKLSVNNGLAKFYINDEFFGTMQVNPATVYTRFVISGIDKDQFLFGLESRKTTPREYIESSIIVNMSPSHTTFSIDLKPYEIGDIASQVGNDLLIGNREGRKYISGFTDNGTIDISNLSLGANFEIVFDVDFTNSDVSLVLSADTDESFEIDFARNKISFGDTTKNWADTGWKGDDFVNECRLTVNNGTAKFFINNEFFGTLITNPDTIYSHLRINGITPQDFFFTLSARTE